MPETSLVVRTFNEEKHLGNLLEAVKRQNYKDYEIVVVDSGSTDKTLEIAREHKAKIIKIESRDFTFGYSLNVGCEASAGKYIVCASAHVLPVDKSWLTNLIEPFKKDKKVAMVYGRQIGHDTSKFSEKRDFLRLFSAEPTNNGVPTIFANNANSSLKKDLWEKRKFDERLFGLEDIDWAKYHREKEYSICYAPKAAIYHIHNEKWHQVYNRYRREAIAAQRIGLAHPPQVRLDIFSLVLNLFLDTLTSFPNWSLSRLEEILRFRYYQWKGSRQGWFKDRHLDMRRDGEDLYFPLPMNEAVIIEGVGSAKFRQ
ncbi:MAG: glycosyltransferase family 2 protein, partial [Patescibacteria group bacterium]